MTNPSTHVPLVADLRSVFRGEIFDDDAALERSSRDASLFYLRPELIVCPKDAADLCALVHFVQARRAEGLNLSLTARSAGTDMSGGPLSTSIVVSMTEHFSRIISMTKDEAVVQPGVFYRDFEKETLRSGSLLPSYPASRELCTVGGMVANNSGGEKTLTYGKTDRYVHALKAVLSDGNEYEFKPLTPAELDQKKQQANAEGEIYRKMSDLIDSHAETIRTGKPNVSKNSAGYALWNVRRGELFDLTQVLVGSQGTLGIVTEITFGLVKPKPSSRLLVIFLNDLNAIADITARVLRFQPESFESYDDHTFKVALRFLPSIAQRMKANLLKIGLAFLPEVLMLLRGGVPKLVLIAQFTGDTDEEAERAAARAQESLAPLGLKTNITHSEAEGAKYWVVRRESFNLLRQHMRGMRTAPFIDDFIVRPEYLPEFLPKLYAILDRYPLTYTIAGHVGDGNFHIIPLMDIRKPDTRATIETLSTEVYNLVLQYHGSITGEHNDGLIRSPFLPRMFGPELYALFAETKRIFDPNGIFNPGKKIGVTLSDALAHLDSKI